jgi:acetylornithine deacetylase
VTYPTERIRAAVAARQDQLLGFCQRLVQAPSLPDQEHATQEIVSEQLRAMGLEVQVLPVRFDRLRDHPAFGDDGFSPDQRLDVIGRWRGSGSGRSLILNGHVDVVSPGDPALWTGSPWSGALRDGRLWGRGSCDMKSGLAAGIFALVVLQDLGWSPGGDIVVESVIGEESGGAGTLATIVEGLRADGAIILEPTRLELCPVQSGALTFRLIVPGQAAHGALRQHGVSAIEKFSLVHAALLQLERDRHAGRQDALYDEPAWVAPLSIGTIRGGEWHSTVAETVVAEGRFGVFPGESVVEARRILERGVAEAAASDPFLTDHPPRVEWFEGQFESGQTPADHPLVVTVATAHQQVVGRAAPLRGVPYGSDLRLFTNHAGMAAVLYGPGDVTLAHAVNESIEVAEILLASAVLATAIADWSGHALDRIPVTPIDGIPRHSYS